MKIIISIFLCLLSVKSLNSQCTGGNFGSNLIFSQTQQTINITGNTYYTFSADSGVRYYIGGGNPQNPSEITILDTLGFYPFTYHSYPTTGFLVNWIAPYSGTFRALVNLSPCQTSQINLGQMDFFRYPDYVPFATDSAQWSIIKWNNFNYFQTTQYKMKGDTVINSINYKKIYSGIDLLYNSVNDTLHCFLREDSRKIYVKYPLSAGVDTSELLLYNFNLELNDTFQVRLFHYTTDSVFDFSVQAINKYSTNSGFRTIYQLRPLTQNTDVWGLQCEITFDWIEGIGAWIGPFYNEIPQHQCNNYAYEYGCYWEKGTYILGANWGNSCDNNTGIEDYADSYGIKIFPNPVIEVSEIKWENYIIEKIELYNSKGILLKKHQVIKQNYYQINRREYAAGLYFIKLTTKEGKLLAKKFLIL